MPSRCVGLLAGFSCKIRGFHPNASFFELTKGHAGNVQRRPDRSMDSEKWRCVLYFFASWVNMQDAYMVEVHIHTLQVELFA